MAPSNKTYIDLPNNIRLFIRLRPIDKKKAVTTLRIGICGVYNLDHEEKTASIGDLYNVITIKGDEVKPGSLITKVTEYPDGSEEREVLL